MREQIFFCVCDGLFIGSWLRNGPHGPNEPYVLLANKVITAHASLSIIHYPLSFIRHPLLRGIHDAAEVTDGFGDAQDGIFHILFVLKAADAAVFYFAQGIRNRNHINFAAW